MNFLKFLKFNLFQTAKATKNDHEMQGMRNSHVRMATASFRI